ncbi:MAG: hypothetical protein J0L67_14720 [Cytophagales bacterium]|nr:hypothetical protein [Cytophagales bacterium]
MDIVSIFADQLTAFRYDTDQPDEFSRLFSQWQDPQYLYTFFTENIEDLHSGFFGAISLQAAIRQTRDEARRLENTLLQLASNTQDNLDSIFEPLRLEEPIELTRSKAKGVKPKSWLRVYAIKLQSNVYVVTGGAIKLTRSMQGSEHTKTELRKFDRCRDFLREQGISDVEGLSELVL